LGFLLDATSFIGFRYSNADTGTVLLKTDILMANLITILVYKQRFRPRDWFFTATVLLGVFMVMEVDPATLRFQFFDVFFILSAFFITLNAFLIQHIQRTYGTPNHVIAYYNNFFTLVLFTLAMLAAGYGGDLARVAGDRTLFAVSAAAACTQTLVYIVYYRCLATLPVYIVKILLLLIPVFTIIFNAVHHWRLPGPIHFAGSILVLGGAFGILYSGKSGGARRP
ncbi:MAG: EamA family transporter, partial [Planctomycetota bacterium]|nr:EamA family transporter [Planctomycetota bacterium]